MTKHRLSGLFVLCLTVAAVAVPSAAVAAPAEQILGADNPAVEVSSARTPAVTPDDSGFNWGDAGLGAAAALAVVTIGVGGALMLRRVRAEHRNGGLTS